MPRTKKWPVALGPCFSVPDLAAEYWSPLRRRHAGGARAGRPRIGGGGEGACGRRGGAEQRAGQRRKPGSALRCAGGAAVGAGGTRLAC